ncbi:MAG: hypothetical protein U9N56_03620 [Actinomycetota bacterium]|nr:hypothetical protein [Actinomycetota bacterium]
MGFGRVEAAGGPAGSVSMMSRSVVCGCSWGGGVRVWSFSNPAADAGWAARGSGAGHLYAQPAEGSGVGLEWFGHGAGGLNQLGGYRHRVWWGP